MTDEVVRAVVLRLAAYGEADRMATFLCADGSRRDARIAQARRSRKRFGGLDLFVVADLRFGPNRLGRSSLQDSEVVAPSAGIRDELVRAALAGHVAELVLQVAQDAHGSEDLYRLTTAALDALSAGAGDAQPAGWARAFELKLVHVLGARPSLRSCAVSGAAVGPQGTLRWSTTHGGVVLPGAPVDARSLPVTRAALLAMHAALHTALADQGAVVWPGDAGPIAEAVLRDFLAVHVGRRDRARRFLSELVGGVAALLLAAVLTGCGGYQPPSSVRIQGWLYESPEPTAESEAVSAASAFAYDATGALAVAGTEPFSDAPGWYRFSDLPPETVHHHVFVPPAGEADHPDELGHITTVVPGPSAIDDLFVDAGVFHLWPRPIVEGWATAWALAGVDVAPLAPESDDGGIVRGQVRDPGLAVGLTLWAVAEDGSRAGARYTDAAGAPDAGAESLSEHGGFFFGQLPAGMYLLEPGESDGTALGGALSLRVEEDGVTSLTALRLAP